MENSHFSYLGPNLNDPEGYGEQVIKLRKNMDATLSREQFDATTLTKWQEFFFLLIDALKVQKFNLCFDSIIEVKEDNERRTFINQHKQTIGELYQIAFEKICAEMKTESMKQTGVTGDVQDWKDKVHQCELENHPSKDSEEMENNMDRIRKLPSYIETATNEISKKGSIHLLQSPL